MATIVFLDGVDEIKGHRQGVQFDISQAGNIVKKRNCPVNHQTTHRMKIRALLKETNAYFWTLTHLQKMLWGGWANDNGIEGPYGAHGYQGGCAGFFAVQLNARIAGDPFYPDIPGPLPLPGVTFTNLQRIDKDTIGARCSPGSRSSSGRASLRGVENVW
ncbi:hypothetical protein ES703_103860 [subsurface metagenome]